WLRRMTECGWARRWLRARRWSRPSSSRTRHASSGSSSSTRRRTTVAVLAIGSRSLGFGSRRSRRRRPVIRVEDRRDANGAVTAFTVRGHADYAEHGRDLVCAAVSVLTQTAVMGLSGAGAQAHPSYEIDEQTGFLSCRI